MPKIFVTTTDLSEESKKAFAVAAEYTRTFGASLKVLAIIEDPAQAALVYALDFPIFPDAEVQEQMKKRVMEDLETAAAEAFGGLPYKCVVREAAGPVYAEIIKFAKESSADAIILATRGRTGLSRLLIGSVAERVVREAECPVIAVPVSKT